MNDMVMRNYLRSGPAPDATVSLTVRIATLTPDPSSLPTSALFGALSCVMQTEFDEGKLLVPAVQLKSEMRIAGTEVPAGIRLPVA